MVERGDKRGCERGHGRRARSRPGSHQHCSAVLTRHIKLSWDPIIGATECIVLRYPMEPEYLPELFK